MSQRRSQFFSPAETGDLAIEIPTGAYSAFPRKSHYHGDHSKRTVPYSNDTFFASVMHPATGEVETTALSRDHSYVAARFGGAWGLGGVQVTGDEGSTKFNAPAALGNHACTPHFLITDSLGQSVHSLSLGGEQRRVFTIPKSGPYTSQRGDEEFKIQRQGAEGRLVKLGG